MARIIIADLQREEKERNNVHDIVRGTYSSFRVGKDVYFQIDTYGSPARSHPDKISQSIQIDRQSAITLIEILKNEFSL
jgi:hypothetical protein